MSSPVFSKVTHTNTHTPHTHTHSLLRQERESVEQGYGCVKCFPTVNPPPSLSPPSLSSVSPPPLSACYFYYPPLFPPFIPLSSRVIVCPHAPPPSPPSIREERNTDGGVYTSHRSLLQRHTHTYIHTHTQTHTHTHRGLWSTQVLQL